jgi:hypothetical protein
MVLETNVIPYPTENIKQLKMYTPDEVINGAKGIL